MSKYKVGDKFIIEIKHGIVDPLYGARYFIKGFNTLVFDDNGLDKLERFDADAKVNADYNSGYEDGMHDAWECARKIVLLKDDGGIPTSDYKEALRTQKFEYDIFKDMPVSEVLSKLKEYEAKQAEIKVGDELQNKIGERFVVIGLNDDGESVQVLSDKGKLYLRVYKMYVTKTGRHFPIEDILEQMRGADDE